MIFYCDFETTSEEQYNLEGLTRVYLWCALNNENDNVKYGVDIDSFIKYLISFNESCTAYFHNLSGFDGHFIIYYILKNKLKYDIIMDEFKKIYNIKLFVTDDIIISFKCSYLLIMDSIEKLGEMIGVKKLNETHNYDEIKNYNDLKDVPQEELDYIYNDTLILKQVMLSIFPKDPVKLTMSSIAYKEWYSMNYWLKIKGLLEPVTDDVIKKDIDMSYYGGICQLNKKYSGQLLHNVYAYDINSMYTYAMYDKPMPCGQPKEYDTIEECKKNHDLFLVKIHIDKVEILDGFIPFIPTKGTSYFNQSYDYDRIIEDKIIVLWEDMFELFEKYYHGVYVIIKCIGFKSVNRIFNKYLDKYIEMKENAKDKITRKKAKNYMNMLYGKFGMNEERISKNLDFDFENEEIIYKNVIKQLPQHRKDIASRITSNAKILLINAIENNADKFVYCDTDSIYTIGKGKDLPIDDVKIGYWKLEGIFDFKGLKAKCYIRANEEKFEPKISGLPKDLSNMITFDNFKFGLKLEKVKKRKKIVKGGVIISKTDFSIKLTKN